MALYDVEGKVALVTGGGSGIGEQVSVLLAASGARVAVADRQLDAAREVAHKIVRDGGNAIPLHLDVTDPDAVRRSVDGVVDALGGLHIGVNNAGIGGAGELPSDYPLDAWRAVMAVNLDGVFYCQRAELAVMRAAGTGGAIVNMASILGQVAAARSIAYVAAKHAVVGLTRAAAVAHAPDRIRVNAVGPGYIDTPLLSGLPAERKEALVALHPIGRLGRAEEVAHLVAWLASDAASFATGAYYPIDGGYLAV